MRPIKVAFVNQKGGTGKTTSCVNIAGELSKRSKVLVLDFDPQGSATSGLGVEEFGSGIYNLLKRYLRGKNPDPGDVILKTEAGPDLIPANLDLVGLSTRIHQLENPSTFLENLLKKINESYDFILIDSPPSYGYFLINAVFTSDYLFVPIDTGMLSKRSLETLAIILKDIENELNKEIRVKVILNFFRSQGKFSSFLSKIFPSHFLPESGMSEEIMNYLGEFDLSEENIYKIPYSQKIYEAQEEGLPLSHYAPNSRIDKLYEEISRNLTSTPDFQK